MKRLTLLRHAKSSWDDASLNDYDRPLNPRGRRDAPEMGRRLKAADQVPDMLISSPAVRAVSTARMAAREMGFPEQRIIEHGSLYHASAGELFSVLASLETLAVHLLVVGHNPGLTDFASSLSTVRIDNLPTASLFCVDLDIGDWNELAPGTGRFAYYDFPKNTGGAPLTAGDF